MVKSVKDFLTEIENINKKANVFYRGHSNNNYELLPGIYRPISNDKSLIEFEDKIYREVISKSPLEFQGKNTLESLVLQQHYGSPTRILDLTENALVALYFACEGEFTTNGEVIVFDIPDKNVCNYDSDKITILSNIAKCDDKFKHHGTKRNRAKLDLLENKKLSTKTDKLKVEMSILYEFTEDDCNNFYNYYNESIKKEFDIGKIDKSLDEFYEKWILNHKSLQMNSVFFKNTFLNYFIELLKRDKNEIISNSNKNLFGKLLHYIKEDKSYFLPIIDPDDIDNVYAVKPKLDNPRIIRQQGAFLIFGIEEDKFFNNKSNKIISKIHNNWILKGKNSVVDERILIEKNSKKKILKELDMLGINMSTLFPEIDKITDWVKNKYQEKLKIL